MKKKSWIFYLLMLIVLFGCLETGMPDHDVCLDENALSYGQKGSCIYGGEPTTPIVKILTSSSDENCGDKVNVVVNGLKQQLGDEIIIVEMHVLDPMECDESILLDRISGYPVLPQYFVNDVMVKDQNVDGIVKQVLATNSVERAKIGFTYAFGKDSIECRIYLKLLNPYFQFPVLNVYLVKDSVVYKQKALNRASFPNIFYDAATKSFINFPHFNVMHSIVYKQKIDFREINKMNNVLPNTVFNFDFNLKYPDVENGYYLVATITDIGLPVSSAIGLNSIN